MSPYARGPESHTGPLRNQKEKSLNKAWLPKKARQREYHGRLRSPRSKRPQEIRAGRMIIVTDDEDRENEGDS